MHVALSLPEKHAPYDLLVAMHPAAFDLTAKHTPCDLLVTIHAAALELPAKHTPCDLLKTHDALFTLHERHKINVKREGNLSLSIGLFSKFSWCN